MIGYNLHKCGGVLGDNVLKRLGAEAGASGHMAACASELSWGSATTITTSAQCYGRSGSGTSCESGWGDGVCLGFAFGFGFCLVALVSHIATTSPLACLLYIYIHFFFFGLRTPFLYCFFLLFLLLVIQASWTCVHALPISLAHRHILLTGIQSCVALRYSFLASSPTSTFDIGLNFIEIPTTTTTTSAMHRGFPFRFALIAFGHCVEQRDILSYSAPSLPALPSSPRCLPTSKKATQHNATQSTQSCSCFCHILSNCHAE